MDRELLQLFCVDVIDDGICFPCPACVVEAHLPDTESGSHREHHIRILDCKVSGAVTEIAGASCIKRIVGRETVLAVPSHHHGDAELPGDAEELSVGACDPDAVACVEDRPLCGADLRNDLLRSLFRDRRRKHRTILSLSCLVRRDRMFRRCCPAGTACHIVFRIEADEIFRLDKRALNIQRDVQPDRTGPSGLHDPEGFLHAEPDPKRVNDHLAVLCHGSDGRADIKFLVSERTDPRTAGQGIACSPVIADLAGNDHHGNGIQPRTHHAGDGVGPAGTGGHADCRRTIVDPGIAFRSDGGGLFMMVVGDLQPRLMAQRVVEMHSAAADHTEGMNDSALHQLP